MKSCTMTSRPSCVVLERSAQLGLVLAPDRLAADGVDPGVRHRRLHEDRKTRLPGARDESFVAGARGGGDRVLTPGLALPRRPRYRDAGTARRQRLLALVDDLAGRAGERERGHEARREQRLARVPHDVESRVVGDEQGRPRPTGGQFRPSAVKASMKASGSTLQSGQRRQVACVVAKPGTESSWCSASTETPTSRSARTTASPVAPDMPTTMERSSPSCLRSATIVLPRRRQLL
jgi:hypothetical protein